MRTVVHLLAAALVAGGIALSLLVHPLTGLFVVEVAAVLVIVDRTVGLVPALTATRHADRPAAWPPTLSWWLWIAGGSVLGLLLAAAGIALDSPFALLGLFMVGLAAWLVWTVWLLRRRERRA